MSAHPPNDPGAAAQEQGAAREQTLYGRKACWAVFTHRPQDIVRIFHAKERRQELAPLLKWAAAAHIPYRELDEDGLRRVSGATHHEGVAMAVRPRLFAALDAPRPEPDALWMALDRIENPYNLGAILRTCAFFGIGTVLVGGVEPGSRVNAAALRAAEGGAETLHLVACPELAAELREMALSGVNVVGLESDANVALGERPAPRPTVLVAGHEQEGLSAPVRASCSWVCSIPGQGAMSSLNVSVSVGVALAALVGIVAEAPRVRAHRPERLERYRTVGAARPQDPPHAPAQRPAHRPPRGKHPRKRGN